MSITFEGDKEFLDRLAEIVLAHLADENFGVNQLVNETGLSTSVVRRMLKTISKKTINQFINEVRLTKALEILQLGSVTASEVAYKVGFSSPAYFNTCFHDYFGYSPGEAKQRRIIEAKEESAEPNSMSGRDEEIPKNFQEQQTTHKKRKLKTIIYASGGILVITFLAWFFVYPLIKNSAFRLKPEDKSIAVLPFKNLSNNIESQNFAFGVNEQIINNLAQIKKIKIVTSDPFKEPSENPLNKQKIANKLGVRFLLTGSVQHSSNRVLIIVRLTDTKRDQIIWSDKYEREFLDIFFIQSNIAKQVAMELNVVLSPEEIKKIEKIPTRNKEAYNLYVDGRYFWHHHTEKELKTSIECFNQAIALDPNFSLAYAGLAASYSRLAWYGWYPLAEGYSKGREFAIKGLRIDSDLAEAHAVLGYIAGGYDRNWKEGEMQLRLAIELNPNYATAHQWYAGYLDIIGEKNSARIYINRALELNPVSSAMYRLSSLYYYRQGNNNEALHAINKGIELAPHQDYLNEYKFIYYIKDGKDIEAIEAIQKIKSINDLLEKNSVSLMQIYEEYGREGIIRWIINYFENQKRSYFDNIPRYYAWLNEKDAALEHLESAFKAGQSDLPRIKFDPDFEILRTEPRFIALLEKMNLGGYESKE